MSSTTIEDFLDGIEERVRSRRRWPIGVVFCGDAENAGTVWHDGDEIPVEQFEARLEHHRTKYGEPKGVARIDLNVVKTDAEPFEQERIGPDEEWSR